MSTAYATSVARKNGFRHKHLLIVAAIAALAACGGGSDDSTPAVSGGSSAVASGGVVTGTSASDLATLVATGPTATVTAAAANAAPGANGSGGNLLTLEGSWATSNGTEVPNVVEGSRINVPAGATLFTRMSGSIVPGTSYLLSAESSAAGAVISVYLINSGNQALKIGGQTVSGSDQATFTAPGDVKGFYLSVFNPTGAAIQVTADLRGVPAAGPTTPVTTPVAGAPATNGTLTLDPTAPAPPATDDLRPVAYTELVPGVSDEFNGTSLDLTKWCTRMPWGGSDIVLGYPDAECTKWPSMGVGDFAQEHENQRFREFNALGEPLHVVSNGTLKLRATKTSAREFQPYESAAIRSKFTFKPSGTESYYIAARVYLPDTRGTLPTVWLNPGLDASPDSAPGGVPHTIPEIDIFEAALNYEAEDKFSMHQGTQVDGAQTASGVTEFTYTHPSYNRQWQYWDGTTGGQNLRDRWVTMGTEWSADEVCFYLEGLKTNCQAYNWVIKDGKPAHPATLIAYYAIGGNWAGRTGIDDTKFPSEFQIDYLRVYKKN